MLACLLTAIGCVCSDRVVVVLVVAMDRWGLMGWDGGWIGEAIGEGRDRGHMLL